MSKNGPFPNYRNSRRHRHLVMVRKGEIPFQRWNELMKGNEKGGTVEQEKNAVPVVEIKEGKAPVSRERETPLTF